ncbi:non-canonical purine NTP pyrophosphatase [Providencia rettgeri]|uniref:non-canonical purine NTP pyrophosphatase n=1 Tax=Providencia rettgeri TaxID=587 RepID=UPI001EE7212B|nr:non-canonical purine NTP pyrophosphatase [Providencia rettgeri]MCG5378746.1 non-canonical purine NTP pyrophosphatase [Providencia rettgeri]
MKIRFITRNSNKIIEVNSMLNLPSIEIIPVKHSIDEIQSEDVDFLVRDKLYKAFDYVGRPVFVEHTGLYIDNLNGFPGGLTQIFWDKLQADKFSSLFGSGPNTSLIAKTVIGYCDSKEIYTFKGEVKGKIAETPRGDYDFQWDCIFIPEGESETFAEMGDKKNEISMRRLAFNEFSAFLKEKTS